MAWSSAPARKAVVLLEPAWFDCFEDGVKTFQVGYYAIKFDSASRHLDGIQTSLDCRVWVFGPEGKVIFASGVVAYNPIFFEALIDSVGYIVFEVLKAQETRIASSDGFTPVLESQGLRTKLIGASAHLFVPGPMDAFCEQYLFAFTRRDKVHRFHVGINHNFHQLSESNFRFPAKLSFGF